VNIAVDWSHTKGLTTYDGKKVRVEDKRSLLKRLKKLGKDTNKSSHLLKSKSATHSPTVILEEGCPYSLIYDLWRHGNQVYWISNRATEDYRVKHGTAKSDVNDARIMWELARSGAKLTPALMDDNRLQLHSLYKQYCRYQKAQVAMQNMKTAYLRYFGDEESDSASHLSGDTAAYDTAINTLKTKEKSVMAELTPLVSGGESKLVLSPPSIKGLGNRIWAGIVVTANPNDFKCLSSYLRFCGLTEYVRNNKKYNRHARWLYYMLTEGVMKHRDPKFKPIFDKCKADIAGKHPSYTKGEINRAAMNRTATMLAKHVFRHVKGTVAEAGE
jgi:hypothetical protein